MTRSERAARVRAAAVGVALATLFWAGSALAQSTIKQPGAHPRYNFEAEPHMVAMDHPGHGGDGFGFGFRGSVVIVDNGFVNTINNSVAIGFGLDMLAFNRDHCHGGRNGFCHDHGPFLLIPVVMQWNFWLHKKWSVFGEPGLGIILHDEDYNSDIDNDLDLDIDPIIFFAGGRFHFNDNITLTARAGFPTSVNFGASFLL